MIYSAYATVPLSKSVISVSISTIDAYVFPDPLDPWFEVFPETYEIKPLTETMFIDFVGVIVIYTKKR